EHRSLCVGRGVREFHDAGRVRSGAQCVRQELRAPGDDQGPCGPEQRVQGEPERASSGSRRATCSADGRSTHECNWPGSVTGGAWYTVDGSMRLQAISGMYVKEPPGYCLQFDSYL